MAGNKQKPSMQGVQFGPGSLQVNIFKQLVPILTATIPGLILLTFGGALAVVSFLGWMSIIFRLGGSHGNLTLPGPILPSGVPLAACYLITAIGGGIVMSIGKAMVTKNDDNRTRATLRHAVVAVVVITGTIYGVNFTAAGVAYSELLPHFASCPWEVTPTSLANPPAWRTRVTMNQWVCTTSPSSSTSVPPALRVERLAKETSATLKGLTVTVDGISESNGSTQVVIDAVNRKKPFGGDTLSLLNQECQLTSIDGQVLKCDPLNEEWPETLPLGQQVRGTLVIEGTFPPDTASVSLTFNTIFEWEGGGAMTVKNIPLKR